MSKSIDINLASSKTENLETVSRVNNSYVKSGYLSFSFQRKEKNIC